jgi:MFS family permease
MTGLSTFLVGCVPTYEQIGIWGAVLMVVLRFIQGIGVGGEWGGSVLLSMEWTRTSKNRGFLAAWPQFGGPAGFFLANLAILAFSRMSGDQFLSWGWRVPFWLSLVMVGIGLWIRLGILETPMFRKVIAEQRVARAGCRGRPPNDNPDVQVNSAVVVYGLKPKVADVIALPDTPFVIPVRIPPDTPLSADPP